LKIEFRPYKFTGLYMAVIDEEPPIPLLFDETLIPKIKGALKKAGPELTYRIVVGCIKTLMQQG